ncbi:MAG: hypothetical protein HOJ86_08950, partial [Acidimicrobiaceae bacterium]|nr:hypothetical protein [Acidimicrobiaceae bacterium]
MAGGRGAVRQVPLRAVQIGFRRRLVFVAGLLLIAAALLVWRLAVVQIAEPDRFLAYGESQRIRSVAITATRGAIVDRNGVDLALSLPLPSLVANPQAVEDPRQVARLLASVLDEDVDFLEGRLSGDGQFAWLGRHLDPVVASEVMDLELPGVRILEERARVRPGERSALGLLGRTNIDSVGISGLELVYDGLLSGVHGRKIVERDLRGASIPGGEYNVEPPSHGRTLVLTIDRSLQFEAERLLSEGVERAGGEGGILVAMDPATGQVLASATVVRGDDGEIR